MWARHRPDVTYGDLIYAAKACLDWRPAAEGDLNAAVVGDWIPLDQAVVCLSVRSGFDLLLHAIGPRTGDEVLFSDVTIRGMLRVAEQAGYAPRGAPIDRVTLAATPESIERRITPRTRAVVVAHLFGSRNPLGPIAEVTRPRGVVLAEDAAQAFAGRAYAGDPNADVTLFSFGMIKRCTAAGGSVLRVRCPMIREAVRNRLATYPQQSRIDYARRLAVLALLHAASNRHCFGVLFKLLSLLGDADERVSRIGKTRPSQQTLDRFRRRPCKPLLRMLARRVQQFEVAPPLAPADVREAMGDHVCGVNAAVPPAWILPATFPEPAAIVRSLRRGNFDASTRSSLVRVANDLEQPEPAGSHWLDRTVFLPTDRGMPQIERSRMAGIALEAAEQVEPAF